MSYTTTDLIDAVARRTAIPISQATFSDQDIVDYLNDELISTITPMLVDIREEFFVTYQDVIVTSDIKSTVIPIPTNTIGEKLRDIVIVENTQSGEEFTALPQLSLEQISQGSSSNSQSGHRGFRLEQNTIRLHPQSGWNGETIRVYYYKRPGELILTSNAGLIDQVDPILSTVSVNVIPTTFVGGILIDIVENRQPYQTLFQNQQIISVVGNTITLPDVTGVRIGDYLCPPATSVVAQVPLEAQRLLIQATKIQLLETLDDEGNIKVAKAKYKELIENFFKAVTNRVDGVPKKVVSSNGFFNATRWY